MCRALLLVIFSLSISCTPGDIRGQSTTESPAVTVGFWNVENLFDTDDDPDNPGDDEFLPDREWTEERYRRKLAHLAEVVAALDANALGLAEVENQRVLEDLLATPALRSHGYRIVHRDSPDKRGIDLALIYRAPFELASGDDAIRLHPIPLDPPTRGILEVRLTAGGHDLIVLVNHWPSRWGGQEKSAPKRKKAADVCRRITLAREDAARQENRTASVVIVGDFNDDPFDPSVRRTLKAVRNRHAVLQNRNHRYFFNPCWRFFAEPETGTLYYNRDWVWNIFDQIIVTRGLLVEEGFSLDEKSLHIYATDAMRDHYRRPKRFRKDRRSQKWIEGYSDHFPIVASLRYEPAEKTGD